MSKLQAAAEGFLPPDDGTYKVFTQNGATMLEGWIDRYYRVHESDAKKSSWQLRCIDEDGDRLRVLIVTGSTTMFAMAKYVAEAFGWRPMGKRYDPQPSKGVLPAGSHWTVERVDDRPHAEPNTKMTGIIGSQKSIFKAAGKGAPFFHDKKVKVFQLMRRRGDTIVFRCDQGKVTIRLDGYTMNEAFDQYHYTPRCVGGDLSKYMWTYLNERYLANKRNEVFLCSSSLTQEEREEVVDNAYKEPLFDNRGRRFNKNVAIEEMHRAVALPFAE